MFAPNQKQIIMETIDFVDKIKTSVITNDTLRFHHILQELKRRCIDIGVRQNLMLLEMGAYID